MSESRIMREPEESFTKEQEKAALSAVAKEIQKPEVQAKLKIDIDNFSEEIRIVTACFESVKIKLGQVDIAVSPEPPLRPQWGELLKRYRQLLWTSRDIATDIATHAEQFDLFVMKVTVGRVGDTPIQERIHVLDDFVKNGEVHRKAADVLKAEFEGLAEDVTLFRDKLDHLASILVRPDDQKRLINQEIGMLQSELKTINLKVYALCAGGIVAVIGASLFTVFLPASAPAIIAAAIGAVATLTPYISETFDKKAALQTLILEKHEELAQLLTRAPMHERVSQDLRKMNDNELTTVINGLMCLNHIWSNINNECATALTYLKAAQKYNKNFDPTTDPDAPAFIVSYLDTGFTIYRGLIGPLKNYATGIGSQKAISSRVYPY